MFTKFPAGQLFRLRFLKTYLTIVQTLPIFESLSLKDLLCKSMDWFLYDRDLRHESVKRPSP